MKKEVIYLEDKNKYLDSVISEIPENAIIYKKITGIGATTLEIKTKRNSIIIEPNTPVILGKTAKHTNLFGVYEGVRTSDIITYLLDEKITYKKLMSTPESFEKIKRAFYMTDINMYDNYFLLFDESHKLTSEIDYRNTITQPMQDFWKFKKRSVISATITNFANYPIFRKSGFRDIMIEPRWHHALNVNLYSSNNLLQDIKHFLQHIPKEKDNRICFFINSIDIIVSIIQTLNIKDISNIYCAEKSIEKLYRKGLNSVSSELTELNQYNFFTSRFFSAVDIITEHKPHIVIVSDAIKAPQTLIEPLLESRQIAGRFRNGISTFTHIAGLDKNIEAKKYSELKEYLKEQRNAYIQLKTIYNSAVEQGVRQVMKEALERVDISKYMEEDNSFNYFMTENLLDSEAAKAKYKTWQDFILSYSLDEELFEIENQYNNIYDWESEKLKISSSNSKLLRKEIVDTFFNLELNKGSETEEQKVILEELKRKDEFIVEICQNFDKEFIVRKRYSKQQLTLALIKKKSDEKSLSFPVIEAVLKSFKIETAYTEQEIIKKFALIYRELGLRKVIKATDIHNYFDVSARRSIKRKDKFQKGYKLLKSKFNEFRT
ncbi:hypothetical protein [Dysgonomonas sp. 520]|uniref:hypothetical protein n=1 Tax=Dysgonomonas sp. 520 TaxID=2302931 RepID=UPI0013CF65B8|nr:hypothetical protein [Dysgonomonas sp. 520]NDW11188.1 hypothetical protein [Dysgonomonas sp. 520]